MKITNLKLYYLIITFNNLWFITSSWLFYWLKFMTIKEVGIIDSIAFFVGIMFEFPSGIISDRLGRKLTLILSQAFQFTGAVVITLATTGIQIGLGFIIFQLGVALYSGTIESFGYESSVQEKVSYDNVLKNSSSTATISYLVSLLIGGYLYTLNTNFPNILWSLNYLLGFIFSLFILNHPKVMDTTESKFDYKSLISKLDLKNVAYLLFFLSICFAFDYGFLKLVILEKFSNLSNNYFYIIIGSLLGIGMSNYLITKNIELHSLLRIGYFFVSGVFLLSYIGSGLDIFIFFLFSFLVIYSNQIFLKYINSKVLDGERASVISFFSLLFKFPYVLLALLLGLSLESQDITVSLWFLGVFMVFMYVLVKFGSKLRYNRLFEKGA